MKNRFGASCCCGQRDQGPPFCWPTIHLRDCDGTPIAGAAVTVMACPPGSGPPPVLGLTDGAGNYVPDLGSLPEATAALYNCFAIAKDGVTSQLFYGIARSKYNCGRVIAHCYRHARVTVLTPPAAGDVVTGSGMVASGPDVDGTVTLSAAAIVNCIVADPYPRTVYIEADPDPASGYLSACTSVVVNCGDDLVVDLTDQFHYAPCYVRGVFGDGSRVCTDAGCEEPGPAGRNLLPKHIQVRCTTVHKPCGTYFAADDGLWITLDLAVVGGLLGGPSAFIYTSGCRDGRGNFMASDGLGGESQLNCAYPYNPPAFYPSSAVAFGLRPGGNQGFTYGRFSDDGCLPGPGRCDDGRVSFACSAEVNDDGTPCADCVTSAPVLGHSFCTPVDFSFPVRDGLTGATVLYTVEVREVPCG